MPGCRAAAVLLLSLPALSLSTAQAATCPLPQATNIAPPDDHAGQTFMTSDTAQVEDDGASRLQGNVRLEHGASSLQADELYFNPNTGIAEVKGNAQFRTPSLQVRASRATINMNTEEGEFVSTHFAIPKSGARGEAKRLSSDAGIIGLQGTHYTTCPEDDEFWLFQADKIALNTNTGSGEAWKTKLRIYDTTVFYLPYIWFPIDDRRISGFLLPSIGNSDDTGFDVSIPYYLNLAPNYDATIIPRYMSERGAQINAEFRYLTEASTGELGVEYLHEDKQTNERRDLELFRHQGLVTQTTALHVDYTRVSDINYYRDLDNTLSASSRTYQDQRAQLSWQPTRWFAADILASRYQTLARDITKADRPYRRLPRIRTQLQTPNVHGLRFEFDTELTRFAHDNEPNVDGWRYVADPAVGYSFDNGAFWFTNRLGLHYTT
ncbi:MAG: LPS assembly protein LptD, partial [Salinisphaeraceae bacterium]|nr:LPS assembly protein LptD [Salinisphaeraceae bacterium]